MPKQTRLKKVEKQDFTEGHQKVLHWFFSFPDREMSLNDLCEELRISKTTANHVVSLLMDEGFLNREVLGRTWRITCNSSHLFSFSRKIGYNLMMIYESGIIEKVRETVSNSRAIVLFGSYRKGDDNEHSDIDIAVEVLDNEDLRIVELGILPVFGYRKNVPVNLHIFSRNKVDLNLFANIANGIVLEGFLEVMP